MRYFVQWSHTTSCILPKISSTLPICDLFCRKMGALKYGICTPALIARPEIQNSINSKRKRRSNTASATGQCARGLLHVTAPGTHACKLRWRAFSLVSLHTASPSHGCANVPASTTESGGPSGNLPRPLPLPPPKSRPPPPRPPRPPPRYDMWVQQSFSTWLQHSQDAADGSKPGRVLNLLKNCVVCTCSSNDYTSVH